MAAALKKKTPRRSVPGTLEALRSVPWLAVLGAKALEHVSGEVQPVEFVEGATILAELELGADLFIIVSGRARVDVIAGGGRRKEIGELGPGEACGEISAITRALRSATVTAITPVRALRLLRTDFEHLVACHPSIAVHFAQLLSSRLYETDSALDTILVDDSVALSTLEGHSPSAIPARATFSRAWRELVISRRRELPFLALISFLVTLSVLRSAIQVLALSGDGLFNVLRAAYTGGIAMVFLSTAIALARFRQQIQRITAIVFGSGFALILNELSVFLAFDTFYLDMTTRDPSMVFSVETLYQRSESTWAIAFMVTLLVMLTYLRHFLRRSLFVLLTYLRLFLKPWHF